MGDHHHQTGESYINKMPIFMSICSKNKFLITNPPLQIASFTSLQMPILPDEIIFIILLHLPAQILHNTMTLVSRTWRNIIRNPHFTHHHLLCSSKPGILEHKWTQSGTLNFQFLPINENSTHESIEFRNIESKLTAQGSCNGVLFLHLSGNLYCVMNPITGERLILPCHPAGSLNINLPANALTYDSSSGRFKAVHFYEDGEIYKRCSILTVGVDEEWREIDSQNLTGMIGKLFRRPSPICAAGRFLYLFTEGFEYQVILDVGTEKVRVFPAQGNWPAGRICEVGGLMKGERFGLVFFIEEVFVWEVWVLEEIENGKWVKSIEIDLSGKKMGFGGRVLDGAGGGDLMVLSPRRGYGFVDDGGDDYVYICLNVKTGEVWKWNADPEVLFGCNLLHVNSLVSLRNDIKPNVAKKK